MSEPSLEVSERARALRNPAKTGPLVYYPSGWGTGHTERSAGPTMVGPADRSQPPPWSARLSFPAFSFPFLRSFLSSSFPSLPFLSLPPPPGHCFRAPATCTHGHCLRAPATCTVRDTVANGTCRRSPQGNGFLPPSSHSFPLRRFPFPFPFSFPPAASLAPGLPSSRNFSSLGETSPPCGGARHV